ncbi:unnamed protein product [Ilex paraguariensis]|uniref:Senescence domain-containing protein n=1 Tax=Ilex paraguariensis TaxID=185542 RepID=A0ABC8TKB2_9AQUA
MASQNPNARTPMYPQVIASNPETSSPFSSSNSAQQSSIYPRIDTEDLVGNLFPEHYETTPDHNPNCPSAPYPRIDTEDLVGNLFPEHYETTPDHNPNCPSAPAESVEETLLVVPGAILHLIDKQYSVELATGDLSILRLRQGNNIVAVLARIADEIQWPLTKDETAVKLDHSHYFFSFRAPKESGSDSDDEETTNKPSPETEDILNYGLTIASKGQEGLLRELDGILENYSSFSVQKVEEKGVVVDVAKELSPSDLKSEKKKEVLEGNCAAYWTTLAPNVEDYSGTAAKLIAMGSGQLIKGILWCGDVTVDRLKWGNEVMKKRMSAGEKSEISPQTLKRIKRYGEEAAKATSEGLDAAGHAIGTAWAVFKIRKALNPKSVMKPTTLAKSAAKAAAAAEKKAKSSK